MPEKTFKEELKVTGDQLVDSVKKLVREANVRKLILKNDKGDKIIEIPVSAATIGAVLLPVLAAIGALAAMMTDCTIVIEKTKK